MKKFRTVNLLFLLLHFQACMSAPENKHEKKEKKEEQKVESKLQETPQPALVGGCDSTIWKRVYDPGRLQVLEACKTVTGTITERNADADGDEHMLLRPDSNAGELLRKKNYKKKEGMLVVEVVCVNNITRKRAKGVCDGYVNNVQLPAVGDHVRVTGSFVIDTHNGWTEIHPATKIEILK